MRWVIAIIIFLLPFITNPLSKEGAGKSARGVERGVRSGTGYSGIVKNSESDLLKGGSIVLELEVKPDGDERIFVLENWEDRKVEPIIERERERKWNKYRWRK